MDITQPEHTAMAVFYDKEEIGSEGNTSAKSRVLDMFLMELMHRTGVEPTLRNLNKVFFAERPCPQMLLRPLIRSFRTCTRSEQCSGSATVSISPSTRGSGGKYLASDANAEYTAPGFENSLMTTM